jgi:predicted murein hydrolase (TIGR00659 family)
MSPHLSELWVYLATSPLLGLTATLLAYQFAYAIYERCGFNPLANPVAISVAVLVIALRITGTSYSTYFDGAKFVHFLLGPATVALAVPLYLQFDRVKSAAIALVAGLAVGSLVAIGSAASLAWMLGASRQTILSLAPKSVTTPIAMGIAEKIGGLPALTAVLVICTGVLGAIMARPILNAAGVTEHWIRGFAVGVAAHGIGTARAFQVSEEMGAFAGLAMGLNGLFTALAAPLAVALVHPFGPG